MIPIDIQVTCSKVKVKPLFSYHCVVRSISFDPLHDQYQTWCRGCAQQILIDFQATCSKVKVKLLLSPLCCPFYMVTYMVTCFVQVCFYREDKPELCTIGHWVHICSWNISCLQLVWNTYMIKCIWFYWFQTSVCKFMILWNTMFHHDVFETGFGSKGLGRYLIWRRFVKRNSSGGETKWLSNYCSHPVLVSHLLISGFSGLFNTLNILTISRLPWDMHNSQQCQ